MRVPITIKQAGGENGGAADEYSAVLGKTLHVPDAPHIILSHAQLEDAMGWEIGYKCGIVTAPGSVRLPLMHEAMGWYFLAIKPAAVVMHAGLTMLSTTDSGAAARKALLMHARLNLTPQGLAMLPSTTTGCGFDKATPVMLKAIEVCEFRRLTEGKTKAHHATEPRKLAAEIGGLLLLDAWGPYGTASIGLQCTYLLGATDEASGKGFSEQTKQHTTEKYITFRRKCGAAMKAQGHTLKATRTDNPPELASDKWENANAEDGIDTQHSTPYDPQRMGKVERMWGRARPKAEAMMLRPASPPNAGFFVHAMQHAISIEDVRVQRGRMQTRFQLFYNRAPDLKYFVTFAARGWARDTKLHKGEGQSVKCIYVGCTRSAFKVVTTTGLMLETDHAQFYEENMILRGVQPSAVGVDAEVQTDGANLDDATRAWRTADVHDSDSTLTPTAAGATAASTFDKARDDEAAQRSATLPDQTEWQRRLRVRGGAMTILQEETAADALMRAAPMRLYDLKATMASVEMYATMHVSKVQMGTCNAGRELKTMQFTGPQGVYELAIPRDVRDMRMLTDAAEWDIACLAHIATLEDDGTLRACQMEEAVSGGYTVYRSDLKLTYKKNQADGSLDKRKARGTLDGRTWQGDEPKYFGSASPLEVKLLIAMKAGNFEWRLYKGDNPNAYPTAEWPTVDGKKLRVYMRMFSLYGVKGEGGVPMIYEVMRNYWDSPIGGRTYGEDFKAWYESIGWCKMPSSAGMYILRREDRITLSCVVTDDILIAGAESDVDYTRKLLEHTYQTRGGYDPDCYAGWHIEDTRA